MSLVIPDDLVSATGMSAEELKREIAIMLFQWEKLTLAQASRLAGLSQLDMQQLLASRHIPLHYDIADFEQDLETLRKIERR